MSNSRDREGYILVDRNMCEWQWWQKHNTVIVFLWLLMKAQFHDSTFCGVPIKRGQVVTTHSKIMQHNKMTKQEVRTAISNLKSTNAITIDRHSRFIVITITNYDEYQNLTIRSTRKQQSNNNHLTIKQQYTNTYNTVNTLNAENTRSARSLPRTINEIDFDRDLGGLPNLDEMPQEADGTKRDIPQRVRKLFDGDYMAYRRYVENAIRSQNR